MTQVSYIQGAPKVPANEMADRGQEVSMYKTYLPYLGLTEGELSLMLLREQLKVYASAYPDFPQYKNAFNLVNKALYSGVHGYHLISSIPDVLNPIASLIANAKENTAIVGGDLFAVRDISKSIHIGDDPIVPITTKDCKWLATVAIGRKYYGASPSKWPSTAKWESINLNDQSTIGDKKREWLKLIDECEFRKDMEKLLNDKLESSSYHLLYKNVNSAYPPVSGSAMNLKRILHNSGIETLANAAGVSAQNLDAWTEIGILRAGAKTELGAVGSIESGFYIAASGQEVEYQKYVQWSSGQHMHGIGIAPAILAAIVALVSAALAAAASIVSSVNGMKVAAMASAQGFGTTAYSAEKGDLGKNVDVPGSNDNLLTYLAIGVGAYFLLDDEK